MVSRWLSRVVRDGEWGETRLTGTKRLRRGNSTQSDHREQSRKSRRGAQGSNRVQYPESGVRSKRRDASRHLASVQELGDRLDDELRLVDLLDVRGARYQHERPRGGDRVDHLSNS
jgi:hypothetical protein